MESEHSTSFGVGTARLDVGAPNGTNCFDAHF